MKLDTKGDDPHALRARALARQTVEIIQGVLARKQHEAGNKE